MGSYITNAGQVYMIASKQQEDNVHKFSDLSDPQQFYG